MIAPLLAVLLWADPLGSTLPHISYGLAVYSNPGVAQVVVENRATWGQDVSCDDCLGYVAVADCDRIGQYVWLARPGLSLEGRYRISDCTRAHDRTRFENLGRVIEVDWDTAQRWHMNRPMPVTVYWQDWGDYYAPVYSSNKNHAR